MPTEGQKKLLEELKNNLALAVPEGQVLESDYARTGYQLEVRLDQVGMRPVAQVMKDKQFYLETITALDYLDYFELVYLYFTYDQEFFRVKARVRITREATPLSVSSIYPAAIWLEREVYDFFGIRFLGHPDLSPFLLPEDADYHPLRKDFTA